MPTVPTMDLSIDAAAAAVSKPVLTMGFLLKGHGLNDAIDEMWREARRFFALPRNIKQSVMHQPDQAFGYFDRNTKQKRDKKEVFDYSRSQSPCSTLVGRATGLIILGSVGEYGAERFRGLLGFYKTNVVAQDYAAGVPRYGRLRCPR